MALGGLQTTVTVGPSGTYTSIADAVTFITAEDSADGYIIEVEGGTYLIDDDSDIMIDSLTGPLTIQSVDGSGAVVIDGDDREDVDRDEAVIMLDLIEMFRHWGACD